MIDFLLRVLAYIIAVVIVQFITREMEIIKTKKLRKKLETILQDKMGQQLDNYFDNYDYNNDMEVIKNDDLPTL